MTARRQIESLTRRFRSDQGLFWSRLRSQVAERGIPPEKALLADLFSESPGLLVGVVIHDRHAYFFEFADTHNMVEAAIARWLPLQDQELGPAAPSRGLIRVALEMSPEA